MTPEAPIQIDLSQENSWENLDSSLLTDNEKKLLAEQFAEESEGIIYLTQEELKKFQDIIASESPEIVSNELKEFARKQIAEGLSSSDLIGNIEGIPEELNSLADDLDELSYERLFGEDGFMNAIDLSDTAKDNISVSLSLSAIEQVGNIEDISFDNVEEKINPLAEKMNIIRDIFGKIEGSGIGDLQHSLQISGNGEQNYIFMDAMEGVKFFDAIFSGDIDINSIESYIEDRNLPLGSTTEIVHRISALQDFSQENVQTLISNINGRISDESGSQVSPEIVVDETINTPESQQDLITRLKNGNFLEKILATILEAMKGFGLYNAAENNPDPSTTPESTAGNPEAEEIAPTIMETTRSLFRNKISERSIYPFTLTQIQDLFPEEGELSKIAQEMIKTIQEIGENTPESFQTEFNNLFGIIEGTNTTKFAVFTEDSRDTIIQDSRTPGENILALLQEYKKYRGSGSGEDYIMYFDLPPEREAQN